MAQLIERRKEEGLRRTGRRTKAEHTVRAWGGDENNRRSLAMERRSVVDNVF